MCWEKWKTIGNNNYFNTESENPILKKDEHHAEIIDITDGLVVDEQVFPDYNYEENQELVWESLKNHKTLNSNNVWNAFGNKKI